MDLTKVQHVFFLGIGGIGMSALARYFKSAGKVVSGYDKTSTSLTEALTAEGIQITFEDDISLLPDYVTGESSGDKTLIIYTPAIPNDHKQYNYILKKGLQIVSAQLSWDG